VSITDVGEMTPGQLMACADMLEAAVARAEKR
jgi:hypothetical protein